MKSVLFLQKRIGIWGFGIVGQSVLRFLQKYPCNISLYDQKKICDIHNVLIFHPEYLTNFLEYNDYIIASPGIDLRPYQSYAHKFVTEIDLFCQDWQKPLITITGTVGKTSTTHLLSELLKLAGLRVATGGNIGTGMLDLLNEQTSADCAVLELSSFQLEYAQHCTPDLAIITNIYPNHLDRHGTYDEYTRAKLRSIQFQTPQQKTLIPLSLYETVAHILPDVAQRALLFSWQQPQSYTLPNTLYFSDENGYIVQQKNFTRIRITSSIPAISYKENWLTLAAAITEIGLNAEHLFSQATELHVPEHRLDAIATIKGVTFYDDSKATIIEATLAAVHALHGKKIILMLGGISKGVDRASAIQKLHNKVIHIICFGAEANELAHACHAAGISTEAHATLESACNALKLDAIDCVLFSPGGASFDLFKDYKERGARFKELILQKKRTAAA